MLLWQLLFHWDASAFIHLQTELCVRLLQEHNRRAIQLGEAIGKLDEAIRPDLEEDNTSKQAKVSIQSSVWKCNMSRANKSIEFNKTQKRAQ